MRRLLVRLGFLALVPLAMIAGNLILDPGRQFQSVSYANGVADIIVSGGDVANLENYDDRAVQRAIAERLAFRPQVLVLGSSRSMQIGRDGLTGRVLMNAAVTGASIEDYVGIYQLYVERGLRPELLVLGIDPWLLNQASGQSSWLSIADAYERGLHRLGLSVPPRQSGWRLKLKQLGRLRPLASPAYFQEGLERMIQEIGRPGPVPGRYFRAMDRGLSVSIKLADGSLKYPASHRLREERKVMALADDFSRQNPLYSLGAFTELDHASIEALERMVGDCLSAGGKVAFFLPPYHPAVYSRIESQSRYQLVAEVENYVRDLADRFRLPVAGSFSPAKCKLTGADFYDGMHPRREAVVRLLADL